MKTNQLRQTTENNGGPLMLKSDAIPCALKNDAKWVQKATPRGPDQASICDELGVRTCWLWEC